MLNEQWCFIKCHNMLQIVDTSNIRGARKNKKLNNKKNTWA